MFKDREYFSALFKIGIPIAFQSLITSSMNAVGVLMIGQLGETAVAAAGLANQVFFLFNLMLFGIVSGSAIFTAQYWGSRDLASIRKVVGICLGLSLAGGTLFTVLALGFPSQVLSIYTKDPAVIELGSQYLRIIGFSYLPTAVSFTYGVQLRATGIARPPVIVSSISLVIGATFNYLLIFGAFGFPEMGVGGAALGTTLARLIECTLMVMMTYFGRFPTAMRLADLRSLDRAFIKRYMVTVLPVVVNESIWSLGISIYNMIYARIGTEAIAAVNIVATIEQIAFVVFFGIANASAIIIGNQIGAGKEHKSFDYARWSLMLVISLAVLIGALMILLSGVIFKYYKISADSMENARRTLTVLACALWVKSSNLTIIVGILRSGGDTRFSMFLDIGTVWLFGIPMALLGAFVFHLPIYWVVAMVLSDEAVKFIFGMYRFLSRKWINNLTFTNQT